MKILLIVESPAKSKTIEKLLGPNYIVKSSFGHIRNLDKKSLGIDVNDGFKPNYRILSDRTKQIKDIQETIKKVDKVLLASDEDREGEAIAWHCAIVFKLSTTAMNRICFHEITKSALENAVANPRPINMCMVHSQQARRILDRLVGFQLSPLLWKYIAPKLSAGRVQSVALKLIVQQEEEINKFTDKKTYKTLGYFDKKLVGTLNVAFTTKEEVQNFLSEAHQSVFKIKDIEKKQCEKKPPPPYITSTIQQDAGLRFCLPSKKIMMVLQKLYESGHITYHRTDSTNLSTAIQEDIKKYVCEKFGKNYLQLRNYKSKIKCAQEAHEAIRPTNISRPTLEGEDVDKYEQSIYNLIWKRTVASQMGACISDIYSIIISISARPELQFLSKAEKIIFDGYKKIYDDYVKKEDGSDDAKDEDVLLPSDFIIDQIKKDEVLSYIKIESSEKYSYPPVRFNEASLIKKMEKIGIGRPSTYSNIIETILDRKYGEKKDILGRKMDIQIYTLEKKKNGTIDNKKDIQTLGAEKKKIVTTELGIMTIDFLEKNFGNIMDYNFTSKLESQLDDIVNSMQDWNGVVSEFYENFNPAIQKLNDKALITQAKNDNRNHLGLDPASGAPVCAYIGKYGPVVQIGEGKTSKFIKIEEPYTWNTVTLNDLPNLTKFPKLLGKSEEHDIYLKKGKFGLYLTCNEKNYKLLSNHDENMSYEDALECINPTKKEEDGTEKKDATSANKLIKTIGKYSIRNGPYGPYILYDKKFYSIPDTTVPEDLTEEMCKVIIKLAKEKPKKPYKKKET